MSNLDNFLKKVEADAQLKSRISKCDTPEEVQVIASEVGFKLKVSELEELTLTQISAAGASTEVSAAAFGPLLLAVLLTVDGFRGV